MMLGETEIHKPITPFERYQKELDEQFRGDFSSRYLFHQMTLEKGGDKFQYILLDLSCTLRDITEASEDISDAHRDIFLNTYLPNIMKLLVKKKLGYIAMLDSDINISLSAFICVFLLYRMQLMSSYWPGDFKSLARILNNQNNLYLERSYGLYDIPGRISSELDKFYGIEYRQEDEEYHTQENKYFPFIAKFFLNYINGSACLVNLIEQPDISFGMVNCILKSTSSLEKYMSREDWFSFGHKIVNGVLKFSETLDEESLRTVKEKHIDIVKGNLDFLLSDTDQMSNIEAKEKTEKFEVSMGIKLMRSTILDKRIIGINLLVSIVRNIRRTEIHQQKGSISQWPTYLWLDSPQLITFLNEQKIFDIIFGEHTHQVIVRKSKELIIFLYEKGCLSHIQIISIWKKASMKHEAMKKAIIYVLDGVIPKFTESEAREVFESIKDIDPSEITEEILNILKLLSKNEVERYLKIYEKTADERRAREINEKDRERRRNQELLDQNPSNNKNRKPKYPKIYDTAMIKNPKYSGHPNQNNDGINISDYLVFRTSLTPEIIPYNPSSSAGPVTTTQTIPIASDIIPRHSPHLFEERKNITSVQDDAGIILPPLIKQKRRNSDILEAGEVREDFKQELKRKQRIIAHHLQEENKLEEPLEATNFQFPFLDYFWDLLMDRSLSSGMRLSVHKIALELFLILVNRLKAAKKVLLLEKAIDHIKNNDSINTCSIIFRKILDSSGARIIHLHTYNIKEEIMKKLDEKYEIIPLVLRSLLEFKKAAIAQALELTGEEHNETLDTQSSEEEMDQGPLLMIGTPSQTSPGGGVRERDESAIIHTPIDMFPNTSSPQTISPLEEQKMADINADKSPSTDPLEPISSEVSPRVASMEKQIEIMETLYTNETLHLSFLNEMKNRLEFITYLLKVCKLRLNLQHLQMLWESVAVNALFLKERDLFFHWLNEFLAVVPASYYHDHTIPNFFNESILRVDFKFLNRIAYNAFQTYFLQINMNYGQIIQKSKSSMEVISDKLISFSCLWEIVLQTRDDSVFKKGSEFLNKIYRGMRSENMEQTKVDFLDLCMQNIRQAKEEITNINRLSGGRAMAKESLIDAKNRMIRSIAILAEYIDVFERLKLDEGKHSNNNLPIRNILLNIKSNIRITTIIKEKLEIYISIGSTVPQLLEQLCNKFDLTKREIILWFRGNNLIEKKYLNATLEQLNMENGNTIIIDKKSQFNNEYPDASTGEAPMDIEISSEQIDQIHNIFPLDRDLIRLALQKYVNLDDTIMALTDENNISDLKDQFTQIEERRYITQEKEKLGEKLCDILSNKLEYFNTLFEILNLGIGEISNSTWELLSKLPINQNVLHDIKTLKPIFEVEDWEQRWKSILNPDSMYKLLYSLQIINSFMTEEDTESEFDPHEGFNKAEWRINFLNMGGYEEIFQIFMELNLDWGVFPLGKVKEGSDMSGNNIQTKQKAEVNLRVKCLNYLVNIIKGFIHSAIYTQNESLGDVIMNFNLSLRPTQHRLPDWKNDKNLPQPECEPEANTTPEFGLSPHSSQPIRHEVTVEPQPANIPRQKIEINTSAHILETESLTKLFTKLLDVLRISVEWDSGSEQISPIPSQSTPIPNQEITLLMESIIDIFLCSIIWHTPLVTQLYSREIFDYLSSNLLINCKIPRISKCFEKFLITLSETKDVEKALREIKYLEQLISKIPTQEERNNLCSSYFSLICRLLKYKILGDRNVVESTTPEELKLDILVNLFRRSLEVIINRPAFESEDLSEDVVLSGYLSLISTLIHIHPEFKEMAYIENLSDTNININININNINTSESKPPHLIEYLYAQLMNTGRESSPTRESKFTLKKTRKKAFLLLISLSTASPSNYALLLKLICQHHESIKQYSNRLQYFDIDVGNRSKAGYVGLKNFGATCYINSLLQQFFMMPDLRNILLSMDQSILDHQTNMSEDSENILPNLQNMFAHLKFSEKQYFAPQQFLKEFKGLDGQPVNVSLQEDCHEFLNLLWDKIETRTKGTRKGDIIHEILGGELSQEIISIEKEYPHRSEKVDPSLAISVEIKGKKSLAEALDLFTSSERMEGENKYFCDEYQRKVNAMKRCCIKSLRNTVIINLKRFDFNYNTYQREKLNDYCSFPINLNLKPWSKEGIGYPGEELGDEKLYKMDKLENVENENTNIEAKDDSYYMYALAGVLVHSGTADGGHYYSYIRERDTTSPNYNKWIEFNDSYISTFDIKDMPTECFGGQTYTGYYEFDKSSNAYMLFYQRINPIPITLNLHPHKEGDINVAENIIQENMIFSKYKQFYDVDYFTFIRDFISLSEFHPQREYQFICSEDIEYKKSSRIEEIWRNKQRNGEYISAQEMEQQITEEFKDIVDTEEILLPITDPKHPTLSDEDLCLATIKVGTIMAYQILLKTKITETFVSWMKLLTAHYKQQAQACLWLLKYLCKHTDILECLIFEDHYDVRDAFGILLQTALEVVYNCEGRFMKNTESKRVIKYFTNSCLTTGNDNLEVKEPHLVLAKVQRSTLVRFMDIFFTQMIEQQAKINYEKYTQYFGVVTHFAHLGFDAAKYLIETARGLDKLYFFTISKEGFPKAGSLLTISHYPSINMIPPIELMTYLITCCEPECVSILRREEIRNSPYAIYTNIEEKIKLPEIIKFIFNPNIYLIKDCLKSSGSTTSLRLITEMILHICYSELNNSKNAINYVFHSYGEASRSMHYLPFSDLLFNILTIDDGYMVSRLRNAFMDLTFSFQNVFHHDSILYPNKKTAIKSLEDSKYNKGFTIDGLYLIARLIKYDQDSLSFFLDLKESLEWALDFLKECLNFNVIHFPQSDMIRENNITRAEYALEILESKILTGTYEERLKQYNRYDNNQPSSDNEAYSDDEKYFDNPNEESKDDRVYIVGQDLEEGNNNEENEQSRGIGSMNVERVEFGRTYDNETHFQPMFDVKDNKVEDEKEFGEGHVEGEVKEWTEEWEVENLDKDQVDPFPMETGEGEGQFQLHKDTDDPQHSEL